MAERCPSSTSVIIVGLSSAMFLAFHGVPTVLLERYPRSSLHPRAIGARVESLAGKWYEEEPWTAAAKQHEHNIEYSPCSGAAIAQDSLEPVMRSAVLVAGKDLPPARIPDEWAGQPGSRALHIWVSRRGEAILTFDLFQRGWVLLFEDQRWKSPATKEGKTLGIALERIHVETDVLVSRDEPQAFHYIAWRSSDLPMNPAKALDHALSVVLSAAKAS